MSFVILTLIKELLSCFLLAQQNDRRGFQSTKQQFSAGFPASLLPHLDPACSRIRDSGLSKNRIPSDCPAFPVSAPSPSAVWRRETKWFSRISRSLPLSDRQGNADGGSWGQQAAWGRMGANRHLSILLHNVSSSIQPVSYLKSVCLGLLTKSW